MGQLLKNTIRGAALLPAALLAGAAAYAQDADIEARLAALEEGVAGSASAYVDNNVFAANGEQENSGVEIAFFGEPRHGLRLLGGWTWLDAEMTRTAGGALDGKRPIGTPELQGNLNVEWDVPQATGLTLEGRLVYTGEHPVNAANTVELDSWTRFDAGVRYAADIAGRPVTLRARIENLVDEDQWVAVGGYPGANYLTLGAPRTLSLSISAEF